VHASDAVVTPSLDCDPFSLTLAVSPFGRTWR